MMNTTNRRAWLQTGLVALGLASAAAPATAGSTSYSLYVLLQNQNQVQVVTTKNGLPSQILGSPIPVGDIAIEAVVSPDNSTVWVPNGGDATVTVINTYNNTTQTYSVLAPQDVGGACASSTYNGQSPCSFPGPLVFNSAGTVAYMVDTGDSLLKYIDTYTHTVVATVPLGAAPFQVRLSPDGNTAYVANLVDNTVSVIDIPTKKAKQPVALPNPSNPGNCAALQPPSPLSGPSPTGVGLTPDGAFLYVTNAYDENLLPANPPCQPSTVTVIRTSDNTVVNPAITSGGYVATDVSFLTNQPLALVANTGTDAVPDHRIGVINTLTQTLVGDIELTGSTNGERVVGPAEIDPDGNFVYIPTIGLAGTVTGPNTGGESITTLSASTFAQLNTFALPPGSFPLSIAIVTLGGGKCRQTASAQ